MSQTSSEQNAITRQSRMQKNKSRVFWFGVCIVIVIVAVIFALAYNSVQNAQRDLNSSVEKDLQNVTFSRASEVNAWLNSIPEQATYFTNSPTIKIFADEMNKAGNNVVVNLGDDESSGGQLGQVDIQLTQSNLRDFVGMSEFNMGGMVNTAGEMYLSTEQTPSILRPDQVSLIKEVVQTGSFRLGPIEYANKFGLVLRIYLPIKSDQQDANGTKPTVAVLYLVKSISPKLSQLFALGTYANQGFESYLLQSGMNGQLQNVMYGQDKIADIPNIALDAAGNIPFGERDSVHGTSKVYSLGTKVGQQDLWVVWEQDFYQARKALESRTKTIYGVAALTALVMVLFVSGLWWWLVGNERSNVLKQFQELFKVIDEQKRLLDSINSTITDPISLTDTKGVYHYVNKAFAQAVGREPGDIPGLDTSAVFGFDTAKRLNSTDQHVIMTSESVTSNETIWLQSQKHYFQISKAPLRESGNRNVIGVVSVFRDITQVVETEQRSRRVVQQTIDALVQAIEKSDPFLGGHSRIMGATARLMCKAMNLSAEDTSTIETAATLSQIGKMFVPRAVLTKPGILTDEEKKVMEQHVEHTKNILKGIEFDLPVLDAIYQMNERLDGHGYPLGLKGDEINIHARVLAVANAFTAMARPRSYRPAMDTETVLSVLEKQSDSYDHNVVKVLRDVLHTPEGEKIVKMAASSKVD